MVVCDYAKKAVHKARQMKALKLLDEIDIHMRQNTPQADIRADMLLKRYEEHYFGTWA